MPGIIYGRTSSKKKKKTAKQLRDEAELKAAAKALQDKWANVPKFSDKNRAPPPDEPTGKHLPKKRREVPKLTAPPGREKKTIPSRVTPGGDATKKPDKVYTGTAMKGVATMHKSNSVPVFDDQHLVDISNMRRNDYTRDPKKTPNEDAGILPPSDQL